MSACRVVINQKIKQSAFYNILFILFSPENIHKCNNFLGCKRNTRLRTSRTFFRRVWMFVKIDVVKKKVPRAAHTTWCSRLEWAGGRQGLTQGGGRDDTGVCRDVLTAEHHPVLSSYHRISHLRKNGSCLLFHFFLNIYDAIHIKHYYFYSRKIAIEIEANVLNYENCIYGCVCIPIYYGLRNEEQNTIFEEKWAIWPHH